ncbi:hypothetical protein CEXT_358131 [Caerostris extrusa]|uniref:Uncharacterized protein n=1 Tax=Caerostris extrusa TaxID=172846 RepID=A0AAV4XN32_CAEEX|nr:hypothetical protein CEXT_358131 [Caerostris extrusa]
MDPTYTLTTAWRKWNKKYDGREERRKEVTECKRQEEGGGGVEKIVPYDEVMVRGIHFPQGTSILGLDAFRLLRVGVYDKSAGVLHFEMCKVFGGWYVYLDASGVMGFE